MDRRRFISLTAVGTAAVHQNHNAARITQTDHTTNSNTKPPSKPNILWIWADNLAWRDLGIYGNPKNKTPAIDQLAREGVRLAQYYIAHTVCSPSRAALLTGRQPFRTGIVDVLRPDSPTGLPTDEITIAETLKNQGYATACIGKWHLGDRNVFLPKQHGFDAYFGLPYSMDMLPTLLYRDNQIVERLDGDKVQNVTERLVDEALDFIRSNQSQPFFLYFSHTLPHPPINVPPQERSKNNSLYEDAIQYMDSQTQRIFNELNRLGLRENTLIFFSSDNGPMLNDGDTGGLRGRIRDSYEGGIRVPLIASWLGMLPHGKVIHTPAIAYDIFPTLLRVAGSEHPNDRIYDGQDIWPLLSGEEKTFVRRKPFVWIYEDNVTAIRDGKWKYHIANRNQALETPELYDLENDPTENNPVNEDFPEVVRRLQTQINKFQSEMPKVWNLKYPVRDPLKRPSGIRRK